MHTIQIETELDENVILKTETINSLISEHITYNKKNIYTNYKKRYQDLPKNRQLLSISLQTKNYKYIKQIMKILGEFNKKNKSKFYVHKICDSNKKENILNSII